MEQWEDMAKRLTDAGTEFVIEPYIRFKGEVGEQATMFFLDPSGNALEFKAFKTWIPCSPNNLSIRFRAVERNIRTTFSGRNPWRIEPQGTAA